MKSLIAVALCAGCTSGTNDVNAGATIGGASFAVVDSASMVRTSRGLTNIVLGDFMDVCATADESARANSNQLTMLLAYYTDRDNSIPPTQLGTYPVSTLADPLPDSGPFAECGFESLDATCRIAERFCDSGTITLTRADESGYTGTFDVVIAGDHVTGSFDTTNCDGVSESGFGTCE